MKTAVVVDDERLVLMILSTFLTERLGFLEVYAFSSPKEALAFIKNNEQKIDLLISDNRMPEMSGLVLIKKVREISPEIKIIYMSGTEKDEEVIIRYDEFLLKPFIFEELKEKMENLFVDLIVN